MFITLIRKTFVIIGLAVVTSVGQTEALACVGSVTAGVSGGVSGGGFGGGAGGPSTSTYPAAQFPIDIRSTDPVGPFPLAALTPFPWATIQGIWTAKLPDGTSMHFSFEVQADCAGRKLVRVVEFDQNTYRVKAEGIGIGMSNDTIVRAAMTSTSSQFMIYIRQFRVPPGKGKISTVVTIRPFDGDGSTDRHLIARKAKPLTLEEYVLEQSERAKREADVRRVRP